MPKEAKRRFVGLDTEEVSLVDTPANEVEFLVVKNTEDPSMGATAKVEKEVVPVEVDGDENVTKALAHVSGIVDILQFTHSYVPLFIICGTMHPIALGLVQLLIPRIKPITRPTQS